MNRLDSFGERFTALEQQTAQLKHQTRTSARRLRWWRGLAWGVVLLSLWSLALPSGKGADAQSGTPSYRFETVDVPFPGAHDTTCAGINNSGVLTGLYLDPMSQDVGFMRVGGKFTLLPLLNPRAIN
jgi:hypothetical protein